MDQHGNQKRQVGQAVAFYTALAICLLAVGVGTWQLLRPESDGHSASSGTASVSASASLPEEQEASDAAEPFGPAPADGDAEPMVQTAGTPDGAAAEAAEPSDGAAVRTAARPSDSGSATDTAKTGTAAGTTKNAQASTTEVKPASASAAIPADSPVSASAAEDGSSGDRPDKADQPKLSGEIVCPLEGETVVIFSMDKLLYNETMRDWRTHDGIDIAADGGTAVVAACAGTVESVAADPIMGTVVTIRHDGNWETVYASLSDMPEVEAGDEVSAGQVIGFVGETAASEAALGPHLHFSVLLDGTATDPEEFLS